MRVSRVASLFTLTLALATSARAQQLTVAAAADLQSAMQELTARFQKETGTAIRVAYGSSGNFYQQLVNGAPFDLFFSANLDYPKKLEAAGLTEPGSFYRYANGKIVIWVEKDSTIDLRGGLKTLLNPGIKKIAIANPEHAPYGQAAVAALKQEGIYDQVSARFVTGENISQTASFVASGAADVGIIALSLALSSDLRDKGRYVAIPADDYPPIEQACVIMRSSKAKAAAQKFLDFLRGSEAQKLLRSYGFETSPTEPVK